MCRTCVAILVVCSVYLVGCTWLLDWHLHDSKIKVDEKELVIEGEEGQPTSDGGEKAEEEAE